MNPSPLPPAEYYATLPKSITGAGAILHDPHGRILLVQPAYRDDTWEIPGGGLEEAAMRKVVERSREMLKVQRKVELNEVFDLSMANEAAAELKKTKWEP